MGYLLGVDVGTTYTGAALVHEGRVRPVALGDHSLAVPSVVYLAGDELVVGPAAERRAAADPSRVVREFKRRVGDPTPIVVGGESRAPESLMAGVVEWVIRRVALTEGEAPAGLAVTHPANWGDHRLTLLGEAFERAGVVPDHLVPEPVAAATFYATERPLVPGSAVAVYDLGGGTFDAAVLRAEAAGFDGFEGFTISGRPDGLEHLGGIDFDHAVFRHVLAAAELDVDELDDESSAATVAAVAQLRRDCVEAKEALSDQTEVSIPVLLPGRPATVAGLTRRQFEAMIRPAIDETLVALRRTIASTGMAPGELGAVLLVGGSSSIPLVARLLEEELGVPIAVDARPKDAISMGAALAAWHAVAPPAPPVPPAAPTPPVPPAGDAIAPVPPELARDLPPPGAPPLPPPPPPAEPGGMVRRRSVRAVAAGLTVAVAGVATVAWFRREDESPPPDPVTSTTSTTDRSGNVEVTGQGGDGYDPAAMGPIADNFALAGGSYTVGAAGDWAEQQVLHSIATLALTAAGATADEPTQENASFPRQALIDDQFDLYWDYVGGADGLSVDEEVGRATDDVYQWVREQDERYGLSWLAMSAFDASTGVVVSGENADRLGISAVSEIGDLIETDPDAVTMCSAGTEEDGDLALQGVQATYGLVFPSVDYVGDLVGMYEAVGDGTCSFGIGPGTEPQVARDGLTVLEDDRHHFYPYNAAVRLRTETLEAHPELARLFGAIAARLDDRAMSELNARVDLDGEDPEAVARDWLTTNGFLAR